MSVMQKKVLEGGESLEVLVIFFNIYVTFFCFCKAVLSFLSSLLLPSLSSLGPSPNKKITEVEILDWRRSPGGWVAGYPGHPQVLSMMEILH